MRMSLCEVISELAALVARQRAPLSAREAYLAFILTGMPYFRDIRRLDLWETAYNGVAPDRGASQTEQLLEELFQLGQYNLYGAYSPEGTQRCYRDLRQKFIAAGLNTAWSVD